MVIKNNNGSSFIFISLYIYHQSGVPNGRSFTSNSGTKAAVCRKASLPPQTQVALRCFSHPTLSLESEQALKDLKRSQGPSVEMRMDVANWALRTSPKFTTGVKYEFYHGFLPVQRSGNSSHHIRESDMIYKSEHFLLEKIRINIYIRW